jgi:hypothetical protein
MSRVTKAQKRYAAQRKPWWSGFCPMPRTPRNWRLFKRLITVRRAAVARAEGKGEGT